MSTQTIQILITAVLALHGVAFARGAFTLFTQWLSRSNHGWLPLRFLLYPSLSAPATAAIAGIFWLLAAIGFLGSAMAFWGILVPGEIWRQLAIGGAIISTIWHHPLLWHLAGRTDKAHVAARYSHRTGRECSYPGLFVVAGVAAGEHVWQVIAERPWIDP